MVLPLATTEGYLTGTTCTPIDLAELCVAIIMFDAYQWSGRLQPVDSLDLLNTESYLLIQQGWSSTRVEQDWIIAEQCGTRENEV